MESRVWWVSSLNFHSPIIQAFLGSFRTTAREYAALRNSLFNPIQKNSHMEMSLTACALYLYESSADCLRF
jgi:hypothetical protein